MQTTKTTLTIYKYNTEVMIIWTLKSWISYSSIINNFLKVWSSGINLKKIYYEDKLGNYNKCS